MRRRGGCLRAVKECMPRRVPDDVLFGERQNELHWETVVKSRASLQSLINTSSPVAQEPY